MTFGRRIGGKEYLKPAVNCEAFDKPRAHPPADFALGLEHPHLNPRPFQHPRRREAREARANHHNRIHTLSLTGGVAFYLDTGFKKLISSSCLGP